ncbi:MAG: sigma-54-dependent Fis family transcriptional regulator [Nitrospirae bacterium]|nr:sigma-54-dependent Fis family transcriptional regulator [Nitrospirota bacterium]
MNNKRNLLIIDDDKLFCETVRDYLSSSALSVFISHTGADGLSACSKNKMDVVLLDQNLPDTEGHLLCSPILACSDQTKIIFITAHPSFDGAIIAIRSGAHDYLSKPFELEELSLTVKNSLNTIALEKVAQVEAYKSEKEVEEAVLIGSKGLAEILKPIELAASSSATVLISGETGTGKNVAAKAIHYKSRARKDAFISINCAAIPENLIESELFGFEKGAFTGASYSKKGIFEMAEDGTLFLDEIGAMPMHLQVKLLGVLEDKKIKRLGSDIIRPVQVRIIAATNSDIENSLDKTFRSDLYYRLGVIRIHIQPLRERKDDIPELCNYLINKISNSSTVRIEKDEIRKLMDYDWPGNVRELRNVLERAFILQKGDVLRPSELLTTIIPQKAAQRTETESDDETIYTFEEMEKKHIKKALEKLSGNYTRTAEALGISLSTLKRKIMEYGLK